MEDFWDVGVERYFIVVSGKLGYSWREYLSRTVLSLGDALRGGVMWVSIHSDHLGSVGQQAGSIQCIVKVKHD